MTEKISEETRKILEEGPPLSWYSGTGYKDKGIVAIGYSIVLAGLAGGKVEKHLREWSLFTGNPVREDDHPERKARAERAIREAEAFITNTTGFSPREIANKAHKLRDIFRGQKSAPFDFKLY